MTKYAPVLPLCQPRNETQRKSKPNITIIPALISDASELATVMMSAYGPDLVFSLVVPNDKARHEALKHYFEDKCGTWSNATVLKAVDDDEDQKIVGVIVWSTIVAYANSASSASSQHILGTHWKSRGEQPEIGNEELVRYIGEHIGEVMMKWVVLTRCDVVDQVVVEPAYQRKGVGTALIEVATERADNERLSLWICSTPKGRAFFKYCGWNTVEEWPIDLSNFTEKDSGYGVYKQSFMLKLPSKGFGEAAVQLA